MFKNILWEEATPATFSLHDIMIIIIIIITIHSHSTAIALNAIGLALWGGHTGVSTITLSKKNLYQW